MIKILWFMPILWAHSSLLCANVLPDGPFKHIVQAQCSYCHTLKLVAQQRMSREKWHKTITWMQKKHNLRAFSPEELEQILTYLSHALGESTTEDQDHQDRRNVNPLPPIENR
jgi:hypothetical protein